MRVNPNVMPDLLAALEQSQNSSRMRCLNWPHRGESTNRPMTREEPRCWRKFATRAAWLIRFCAVRAA